VSEARIDVMNYCVFQIWFDAVQFVIQSLALASGMVITLASYSDFQHKFVRKVIESRVISRNLKLDEWTNVWGGGVNMRKVQIYN